jgi:ComEC/Rec2-related protein
LGSVIRDFRATGTLHLFAVSGMNIAVLAIITRILVRPIGLISPIGITFSVICITIYAIATRLAPSCQRALLMAIIPLLAPLARRPSTLLDTLTATVAFLLAINPNMLFDIGFQLSVALVVGLASISPILSNPIRPDPKQQLIPETLLSARHRFIRAAHCAMADSIGIAVTASMVSLPWSIFVFRQIPLHAPLINLVAVPLANLQLVGAFAAILFAPIPSVSRRITDANLHVARSLATVVRWGAKIPKATLIVPTPALKGADFLFLDVPSVCVALLGNPNGSTLVNTGSETNFRAIVARALTAHGTVAPHSVLLTTGDSAHLGGAVALLESSPPSAWYLPSVADRSPHHRHLREWLDARGIPKRFLLAPNTFQLPDASRITCLHPPNGFHASSAADNATVLLWEKRGTRILLTGTAGFVTEQRLTKLPRENVRADIWFKGLHPRDVSGSPTLLEHIDPRVMVLNRNPYRASDPSVTSLRNLCASRGTALLEMDATGAIVGSISAQAVKLTPFRGGEPYIEIPIEPQRFGRK